jgi:signal transduction histidine kinase
VRVSDLVDDVLTVYERKFKYKSLRVDRRIDPGLTVYTLQGELKQILSNLIANAIDACKEGDKIVVHARNSHDFKSGSNGMRMTIADTGVGIAEEDKARLFAPFFTTKKDVGTGLGLWITRDLLEKKGGHIRVRSRDSNPSGTVMSIYLPQATPEKSVELAA